MKTYDERARDVSARITRRIHRRRKLTACAGALTLVLALVLFLPYPTDLPDVSGYSGSAYYSLIQRINEATYTPPAYVNNFDALVTGIRNAFDRYDGLFGSDLAAAESAGDNGSAASYVEVTDNQVSGIIEGDIIKRSTEYIYYLRDAELSVYSIAQADSVLVGKYLVSDTQETEYAFRSVEEMYLSDDCTTLTLVVEAWSNSVRSCTLLLNLNVSDPANITETGRVCVTGSYLSSRMAQGDILLMTRYTIPSKYRFTQESTYLPQTGVSGDMTSIPAENIQSPEEATDPEYTVICLIDGKTLTVTDTDALFSYSDTVYVSQEHIYVTRSYTDYSLGMLDSRECTEISCLAWDSAGLSYLGSVCLEGTVKNQYSMDEYEGTLRVVTTVHNTNTLLDEWGQTLSFTGYYSASLYCVSLTELDVIAAVECFAPKGEEVESVRFDGDYAYVCTAERAEEIMDPVFFFDLSDLDNITYTDTGTIPGYSISLIQLGDGDLMGIGYGEDGGLKIEIYREEGDSVVSVCSYGCYGSFSTKYKAYLIDREKGLIGLGVRLWDTEDDARAYILLQYDGSSLTRLACVRVEGSPATMRAVIIDDWLYILSDGFAVVPLS